MMFDNNNDLYKMLTYELIFVKKRKQCILLTYSAKVQIRQTFHEVHFFQNRKMNISCNIKL
jgi:hypothetical protein